MKTNLNLDKLEILVRLYVKSSFRASKRGFERSFYAKSADTYKSKIHSFIEQRRADKEQVDRMIKIYQDRMEIDGKF
jgi:hypothetical protein